MKSYYSIKQILWLEYEINKSGHYIHHARNGGEQQITLLTGQKILVDGLCLASNTVYQFHGCFYHGCPEHYESSKNTPHRVKRYRTLDGKEEMKPIKFGQLLADTIRIAEEIKNAGYTLVEMWECQWDNLCKVHKLPTTRADIEHVRALVPRDAYFGGRTNASVLYFKCTGSQRGYYLDVNSMYPFVMSAPQFFYPIGHPIILKKGRDEFLPLDDLFGLIRCRIRPPDDLYFPILPERDPETGKVLFHLNVMQGTWVSFEVHYAVSRGYVIEEIFEQHHFPQQSNTLFAEYNKTFFDIKRKAKMEGNKGLEAIAKMCINGPTGKWGFNPSKQKGTRLVTETSDFYRYLCGSWSEVSLTLITDDVALATVCENDEFTEHTRSNVYISAFITCYSRLKLLDAMEYVSSCNGQVLYYDTDSIIYVSPTGEHLITPDTSGDLGEWSSELPVDDYITEFASAGPKTYSIRTASGKHDISKSKGFSLHYKNQQVFNFESLKEQAISKGLDQEIAKLQLHLNETIMRRKKFEINVEENKGKIINNDIQQTLHCESSVCL